MNQNSSSSDASRFSGKNKVAVKAETSLCYKEPQVFEFEAVIVKVIHENSAYKILLDKTYFLPEGGGQPSDRGWINDVAIIGVKEENGEIFHYAEKGLRQGPARSRIDKGYRHDFMQQHTGQHVISTALWTVGRYKTISVHMGELYTTIDIDAETISSDDIIKVEQIANRIINDNLAVDIVHTDVENLHNYPLRKETQVEGDIRLVHIQGVDWVGCCGLHLKSTGYVGLVKCIGKEKIRANARLTWKIGERAYRDYDAKTNLVFEFKTLLDTGEENLERKTARLIEDHAGLKRKCNAFEMRVAELISNKLIQKAKLINSSHIKIVTHRFQNEDPGLIKNICKQLIERETIVFCITNLVGDRWYWNIGCFEKLHCDFSNALSELLKCIDGKGGGKHPLWQGVGFDQEAVDTFENGFRAKIVSDCILEK